ncbi:substrate-binding domain-containing protein [Saccharothrix sp. 6-C]|uniref:substrate-binding domain-containing protein n=1 Tax=Saccharothrix sp. 6-C TaxID=2781735 RepID=UPI0019172509|nr:substrate-binding domain-containing protein [Saccharothrix sp. 6-C]QQQ77795.1 substrate-binding domain-containing protein [Saccharothrix sp. 6-C]
MGTQPLHAVHRTVVVVDVVAFSRRSPAPQAEIRRGLYAALEAAFEGSGLDWSAIDHEDRGDGVLVLVPPDVPKSRVVGGLPHALLGELRRYNATRTEDARIRLRMAITAGEVRHDEHGVLGGEVTLAFRLLDSRPLREAVERSAALFALIVSDRFYDDVVGPNPAMDPESFRRVGVEVKEVRGHAWLHVPHSGPVEEAPVAEPVAAEPVVPTPGPPPARRRRLPASLVPVLLFVAVTNAAGASPPAVPPCPPPVQLNVLTSTELEGVVRSIALEFEEEARRRNDLGCREVDALVFSGPSDEEAAAALGRGWSTADLTAVGPEPHVWLPDSTAEVRPTQATLRTRTDTVLSPRGSVAVSPVVVGAAEELAVALDGGFRWEHAVRTVAVDTSSGVGVVAAAALAHAKLGGLYLRTREVPRQLHEITRAATAGPACVGDVLLVGSEKAVAGTTGCRVVYPRDRVPVLDHPFVEVERPTRPPNERRRHIVDRFHEHLLAPPAQDAFRRAGFRDVDWNVGSDPGPGVRADRPQSLPIEPDAKAIRAAWKAASRPRVIGVAGDGSPDATRFLDQVRLLGGPADVVIALPLSEHLAEEAVKRKVDVVVLATRSPAPEVGTTLGGAVEVVAVGFEEGACTPSTALYAAADDHGGSCHEIVDKNGSGPSERQEGALGDIARAAWGD